MKILYVVNDLYFFNSHRLPLALRAIENGDQVFLASNKTGNKKSIKYFKIEIHRSNLNPFKNIKVLLQLVKIINKVKPDIIHNITLKPILFLTIISLFNKKIKTVNAVSGLGFLFTSNRKSISKSLVELLLRFSVSRIDSHYIFQNKVDLGLFKKLGLKNNHTMIKGSGVNKEKFNYHPEIKKEKIEIVFTGRILKDKGVLELIQAVKKLPDYTKSKILLKIYGKIDLVNPTHLKEFELKKLLIKGYIEWEGFTKDIRKALVNSDIYCFPSYREGLPKAIVEAMAIGRPIITTNAPGCDDTVIEGYNGFKVPVSNVEMLTQKLQLLIEDYDLRSEMGKNSRSFFEKEFTLDQVIKKTFDLYNKVLKTP